MSVTTLEQPQLTTIAKLFEAGQASPNGFAGLVLSAEFRAVRESMQRPVTFERRQFGRIPLPMLLQVTPLDQTGQRLDNLTTTVVGKDISPRGLSFFHSQPLPYRRAIVTFDHPEIGRYVVEVDIGWCQFTECGWYVSGARQIWVKGKRTPLAASPQSAESVSSNRDGSAI